MEGNVCHATMNLVLVVQVGWNLITDLLDIARSCS